MTLPIYTILCFCYLLISLTILNNWLEPSLFFLYHWRFYDNNNETCLFESSRILINPTKVLGYSTTENGKLPRIWLKIVIWHLFVQPLSERMDEYVEDQCLLNHTNPRVLPMPPPLSPVPCKPLFFDLALNHIEFPSLEDNLPEPEAPSPAQQKAAEQPGGLSGLVKGLWGWGSKK